VKKVLISLTLLLLAILGGLWYGKNHYPWLIPNYWKYHYQQEEMGGAGFQPKTLIGLNQIRITIQKRFNTTSGYRSPEYNQEVGGVSNSMHLQGIAVDVTVPYQFREEFYQAAKGAGFTAFGWGRNTVHIDMGKRRWWTYNNKGKPLTGAEARKFLHYAPPSFHKDFNTLP
jgi:hypothetical protein